MPAYSICVERSDATLPLAVDCGGPMSELSTSTIDARSSASHHSRSAWSDPMRPCRCPTDRPHRAASFCGEDATRIRYAVCRSPRSLDSMIQLNRGRMTSIPSGLLRYSHRSSPTVAAGSDAVNMRPRQMAAIAGIDFMIDSWVYSSWKRVSRLREGRLAVPRSLRSRNDLRLAPTRASDGHGRCPWGGDVFGPGPDRRSGPLWPRPVPSASRLSNSPARFIPNT